MVMKHKVKRVIGLLLIAVLMSSVATGCGKTTLTNTVQNENKQKDSDAWMEDDASGQKDTDKSETSKEEEYYDVDKIQGGEVDYSKYEEKKSSRAASGNSNSNDRKWTGSISDKSCSGRNAKSGGTRRNHN